MFAAFITRTPVKKLLAQVRLGAVRSNGRKLLRSSLIHIVINTTGDIIGAPVVDSMLNMPLI